MFVSKFLKSNSPSLNSVLVLQSIAIVAGLLVIAVLSRPKHKQWTLQKAKK